MNFTSTYASTTNTNSTQQDIRDLSTIVYKDSAMECMATGYSFSDAKAESAKMAGASSTSMIADAARQLDSSSSSTSTTYYYYSTTFDADELMASVESWTTSSNGFAPMDMAGMADKAADMFTALTFANQSPSISFTLIN